MDDSVDLAILAAVSRDGRATLAQLSEAAGLSVSAVQSRLRRLESRGVIAGYRAVIDAEAVGKPLAAFIEITPLDPAQPDNAPELLEHLDAIEACHSIAGDASYMLFVRVASPRGARAAGPRHPPRRECEHPHDRRAADLLRAPSGRAGRGGGLNSRPVSSGSLSGCSIGVAERAPTESERFLRVR